jgi:Zn-dependent membrane protease YugP
MLLDHAGIQDVRIVPTNGFLSDHYNPASKTLALSENVYYSDSIAAVGVATHEAGHAIQHARSYAPLALRSALVPLAGIGSNLSYLLVTLPVEFDASARAKRLIVETGIIDASERKGVDRVLNAAALTYVAAVLTSLLTLLYYLYRAGLIGGRRSD